MYTTDIKNVTDLAKLSDSDFNKVMSMAIEAMCNHKLLQVTINDEDFSLASTKILTIAQTVQEYNDNEGRVLMPSEIIYTYSKRM